MTFNPFKLDLSILYILKGGFNYFILVSMCVKDRTTTTLKTYMIKKEPAIFYLWKINLH